MKTLAPSHLAVLAAVVVAGVLGRLWQLGTPSLVGDEAYYWLWSRHLAWSYYDHPSGVAWVVAAGTALFGQSEVGVRSVNALLGAGCIGLVYALGRQLHGPAPALLSATVVALGGPFLITSRLVYTDTAHLFLLLANLLFFLRLADGRPPARATALAFGVTLALLLNTKYSAYLYAAALAAGIVVARGPLPARRDLWLAAALGGIGLLPALLWNYQHDWASYRWQLAHWLQGSEGGWNPGRSLTHAAVYLTPPVIALAALGLAGWASAAQRAVLLAAVFLTLPVLLGAADSPRNTVNGVALLIVLAGGCWSTRKPTLASLARRTLLALGVIVTAVYGIGTVHNLTAGGSWPASSAVPAIRGDAAGWKQLGPRLAAERAPILAIDYSLAGQVAFYSGRPAYTAWGQYRLWGVPDLSSAAVVAREFVPAGNVSERLRDTFGSVTGPEVIAAREGDIAREIRLWRVADPLVTTEEVLDRLDFLTLRASAPATAP